MEPWASSLILRHVGYQVMWKRWIALLALSMGHVSVAGAQQGKLVAAAAGLFEVRHMVCTARKGMRANLSAGHMCIRFTQSRGRWRGTALSELRQGWFETADKQAPSLPVMLQKCSNNLVFMLLGKLASRLLL